MNAPRSPHDALNDAGAIASTQNWQELISQPGDELDQMALLEAGKRSRAGTSVSVLQVDCGDALLGLRLAKMGATVLAVDQLAGAGALLDEAVQALGVRDKFRFQVWDSGHCPDTTPLPGTPFDIVACPHSLSYQPYAQAHTLLRRLALMTKIGGKLFISAYGVHSELSADYADEHRPVRQRFCELAPAVAKKYGIHQALCLYSERDLFLLLFEAGLSVVKTFTTTHGNVKAIAVRV
jgi:hypothetical protein